MVEGTSGLVELPVIGWIGCDLGPEWKDFNNSPPFDLLVKTKDLIPKNWIAERYMNFEVKEQKAFPGLYERWKNRYEIPVDIWPTLFHPRELHEDNIKRLNKFIRILLEWDDVKFSTAYNAVLRWKKSNLKQIKARKKP